MKTLTLSIGCGLILSLAAGAYAAEIKIYEYPDKFVVDYDGSMDPKLPPQPPTEADLVELAQARRLAPQNAEKAQRMLESRMERTRARNEAIQQALERRKGEQQ